MGSMIVRVLPLLVAALAYGQDKPARLTFEVASVKPSKPGERGGAMKVLPGGQEFIAQNFPLRLMIARMHWVPARQVTGGPDWMDSELWDIQAKADRPGYTREQMLAMLGNLLEDEFKMKLRKVSSFAMKRDCSHMLSPGGGNTPPTITSPTSPSA